MSIATELINIALNNANNMRSGAQSALGAALGTLDSPSILIPGTLTVNEIRSEFDLGEVPQFGGQHYNAPAENFGDRPELDPTPTPSYGVAPVLTASKPAFRDPLRPSSLPGFYKSAPTIGDLTVPPSPDALSSMNLVPPTLTDIVVPPAPSVVLPEFLATAPNTDIAAPTDFAATFAANYANMSVSMRNNLNAAVDAYLNKINPEFSTQMARLESKLAEYLEGGTGLSPEVEQAIFNRARDKTNGEYLRTRDQIMKDGAAAGFTIPGGAQYAALARARQGAADNNARAALDIAIKQAELEQANVQFAVTQSANLRGVVLNAAAAFLSSMVQINGQALEYSRDVLQAAIALYDTMVKIATARIEIYKAEAQVYEVRLRAVLAVYDVYQAEIKSLEAQVNVDRARVDAFRAQADAYGALANAYKATIDGVMAKAQIEKIRVDAFGAEVQAYSAEVGGKQAEWQGFVAQVNGESAKQQAYGEEVRAFGAETDAYKTRVGAFATEVQAVATKNEGALKVYQAAIQAYTALVNGASESAKAEVMSFETTLRGYIASAQAEEAKARSNIAAAEATIRNQIGLYSTNVQLAIASADGYNKYMTSAAGVAVSAAGVYANMASSAMAGVNALGADISTT